MTLGKEFVAVLYDLMRATDEVHVVLLEEAGDDVGTKGEGDATIVFRPSRDVLVRV